MPSSSEHLNRHQQEQAMSDESIRGRFDGIDIFLLNDVYLQPPSTAEGVSFDQLPPWDRPLECTFTGQPTQWTPAEIVSKAVWASSGRDPEMVLDGYCPGPNGRWSVRVHQQSAVKEKPVPKTNMSSWWNFEAPLPQLQPSRSHDSASDDGDGGSSPILTLRRMIFGDSTPDAIDRVETLVTAESSHSDSNDPMQELAARCSIPIDLDDDTFIITTREHIHSLHDVASASITQGNFQDAHRIMESLLQGLGALADLDLRFMKGAALHNLGLLELWMGQFSNAAITFCKALDERNRTFPSKHPDIAVTLSCKAAACFAVGRYGEAIAGIKEAIEIIPPDHRTRAKLLNNLGVIYSFHNDYAGALRELTSGLEIQRQWLDVPVRRETTVYDAAVLLSNMGRIYLHTDDNELALYVYEEALLLETTIFRKDHDFVLATLTSLAIAKAAREDFGNALQILQGCLRSQNNRFGVLSTECMETVGLSSYIYARMGDFESALKCLETVRKWQKVNLPENHTALLKSDYCQKALAAKLGKNDLPL